jgi:ABC-type polysaccharide/polyol phosphate export permease
MTTIAELAGSRELMANLTLRELRGKYKRSLLGWSWSLLNPLATMLVFTLVFRFFLKIEVPVGEPSGLRNFAFYLLCALLPFNFLSNGMVGGMGSLIGNSNLIKKVWFPREILVAANVASWLVSFLIEMGVLAVAFLVVGNMVLPWLPVVLLVVIVQALFTAGLGLALGALNVYFRDIQHLIGIFLQLWFYATPIVYPVTLVPERAELWGLDVPVRFIYGLNPMVRFADIYRDLLYDLHAPSFGDVAYVVAAAAVALGIGLLIFNRLEPRLAEEL